MKQPYAVSFVQHRETLQWILLPDAFEVRKDFRWKWQAQLSRWLIRKIGVNAREPTVDYQPVIIDPTNIMQAIHKMKDVHLDYRRSPQTLLIGAEEFAELMHTVRFSDMVSIDCEYHMSDGRN
jgi:hypothetical protein